jgi:Ni/Co efflux regulator RcnB
MKKILSFIAMIAFVAALSVPVYASSEAVIDEEPKKEQTAKDEKKAKKADKKSDCSSTCGEKKQKSCGDKDKK